MGFFSCRTLALTLGVGGLVGFRLLDVGVAAFWRSPSISSAKSPEDGLLQIVSRLCRSGMVRLAAEAATSIGTCWSSQGTRRSERWGRKVLHGREEDSEKW